MARVFITLLFLLGACGYTPSATPDVDASVEIDASAIGDSQPAPCLLVAIEGQSNARGGGIPSEIDPQIAAPFPAVQLTTRYADNTYPPPFVDTPLGDLSPRRVNATQDKFGIELTLGRKLAAKYPDRSIVVAKFALDSTSLAGDWNPANPTTPNKFSLSVDWLKTQLSLTGCTLHAYLWIQGENDGYAAGTAGAYGPHLVGLVDSVRTHFGPVPFVYGRLNAAANVPNVLIVREQQEWFQTQRPNVTMIDQDPYTLGDGLHYTSSSLVQMGDAYAEVL